MSGPNIGPNQGRLSIRTRYVDGNLIFTRRKSGQSIQYGESGGSANLDLQFFGDTSGVSMLWDSSADALVMAGGASFSGSMSTGTSGLTGLTLSDTFSLATSGVHKTILAECIYTPATSGFGTPIAIVGMVRLTASNTYTGGQGAMYGVQGQLDFGSSSVVNQASSIFAALRGVMTATATPTFTEAEGVCNIYLDNLIAADITGLSTGFSSHIFCNNSGGAMDNAIYLRERNDVPNLFRFEDCGGMVVAQTAKAGTNATIQVDWEGTTYFINMYQA